MCQQLLILWISMIFVHGLNGTSRGTWTKSDTFWPVDMFARENPHCRIFTFGYNANLFFDTADGSITTYAESLLADLVVFRKVSTLSGYETCHFQLIA